MSIIHLTLPAIKRRVPIVIGSGTINDLASILDKEKYDRLIVIYDEAVKHIAKKIAADVSCQEIISVPSGEKSKTLEEAQRLIKELMKAKTTRNSIIILVGGGMVTDIGGFVSSIFMRGVRFINIPTSLLCMVDASIGGKTGVDLDDKKNMIGTITHPTSIVIDTQVLTSLPKTQLHSGIVEAIKMSAIIDVKCFEWFEKHIDKILSREDLYLIECIEKSVKMKIDVVEDDEREFDKRMLLNFGHTVGHALETLSKFTLSHGEAISRGMVAEMTIAGTKDADRVTELLNRISMPTQLPKLTEVDALWTLMENDKKNIGNKVRMTIPLQIGIGKTKELKKDQLRSICI